MSWKIEVPVWKVALLAIGAFIAFGPMKGCEFPGVIGTADGPRELLLVRETADNTPEMARFITELRAGNTAKYLKEKQHKLQILDQNGKDESGNESPLLSKYKPYSPPELLIIAPPDKLLSRQKVTAKAEDFLAAVKANGG